MADEVASLVRAKKAEGCRVYVNATGGFKPETAFMVIVAMLVGADRAYYIHEAFREVVEVPLLPITIDERFIEPMVRLKGEVPMYEAEKLLQLYGGLLSELEGRGVVERRGGFLRLRRWVEALISQA